MCLRINIGKHENFLTVNGNLSGPHEVSLVPHQDDGYEAQDAALPQPVEDHLDVVETLSVSQAEHDHNALVLPNCLCLLVSSDSKLEWAITIVTAPCLLIAFL